MAATVESIAADIEALATGYLAAQLAGNRRAAHLLIDQALSRGMTPLDAAVERRERILR